MQSEVRTTLLGHLQRGGSPTAYDRVLATRFGVHAAHLVRDGRFGEMVALQGDACTSLSISGLLSTVSPSLAALQRIDLRRFAMVRQCTATMVDD